MADFDGIIPPPLPMLVGEGNELDVPGTVSPPLPMAIGPGNELDVPGTVAPPLPMLLGTPGFPPSGPGIAPTVTYVSPPDMSTIEPDATITIDVTDPDSGFAGVFLFAVFSANGSAEVVYDGAAFEPFYGTSSMSVIPNGFRFEVRRSGGGWIAGGLEFKANAIDNTGAVAT